MTDSFSCTPLLSGNRLFNNAFTSNADVYHIVMTLLRLLMMSLRSVRYTFMMAYTSPLQPVHIKHVRILDFYLTLGRITWVG